MSITIRVESAEDTAAVRAIHLAAFPTPMEADLVEQLRKDCDSEISLVAETAGRIVGHILLSRMQVSGDDGRNFRALGLAPVAVLPDDRRRGIGSALINEGLDRARAQGEEIVFLVGEPAYYERFGFSAATAAPFSSPYAGPYLMAQALKEIALPSSGRADYAPAFAGLD